MQAILDVNRSIVTEHAQKTRRSRNLSSSRSKQIAEAPVTRRRSRRNQGQPPISYDENSLDSVVPNSSDNFRGKNAAHHREHLAKLLLPSTIVKLHNIYFGVSINYECRNS